MPEILQGTASAFDPYKVFSIQWWLQHLSDSYSENPGHTLTEFICFCVIVWLLFKRPKEKKELTKKDKDFLLKEWCPEPLVPDSIPETPVRKLVIENFTGTSVKINGRDCVNFTSYSYLNMGCNEEVKEGCKEIIKTYGVGSCGPRGFYGTMDIHLQLEKAIPRYFGIEDEVKSIIYADSIALAPSVITAFAKRGDLLVIDDACHYLIQNGANLARCNVIKFKHNDMGSLENILKNIEQKDQETNAKIERRYIVVEGVYHNSGDICNLTNVCNLKNRYRYRLMIDDSNALGTLAPRGSPDYWSVQWSDIDIYFCGLDTAIGSTGGFSMAAPQIIEHQILSASGYVFSASSPPFQVKASQIALELLAEDTKQHQGTSTGMVSRLQANSNELHDCLKKQFEKQGALDLVDLGKRTGVALIHLQVPISKVSMLGNALESTRMLMENIADRCLEEGYVVATSKRHCHETQNLMTTLRICVNVGHSTTELSKCAVVVATAWKSAWKSALESHELSDTPDKPL